VISVGREGKKKSSSKCYGGTLRTPLIAQLAEIIARGGECQTLNGFLGWRVIIVVMSMCLC